MAIVIMRGSRKLFQRGSNFVLPFFFLFFFYYKLIMGERIQLQKYLGHYRPAGETPLKWRFAGRPIVAKH